MITLTSVFLFVQPQYFINLLLARTAFQIQKAKENSSAVSDGQLIQRFFYCCFHGLTCFKKWEILLFFTLYVK